MWLQRTTLAAPWSKAATAVSDAARWFAPAGKKVNVGGGRAVTASGRLTLAKVFRNEYPK